MPIELDRASASEALNVLFPIIEIASWHLLDGFIRDCANAHNSVVFCSSDKAYCAGYYYTHEYMTFGIHRVCIMSWKCEHVKIYNAPNK